MCGICNPSLLESLKFSVSCTLVLANTELRNSHKNDRLITTIGRRVFGELGYAALLLVSLVEAVVRAILIIPALLISALTCFNEKVFDFLLGLTLGGAVATLSVGSYGSVVGLVQNIYKNTITYNDMNLCLPQ